jgi:predicted regulator of amino acid metabolism with ACT domain
MERQLISAGVKAKVMQVENEMRKTAGDAQLSMRDTAKGMQVDRQATLDKLRLIEKEARMNKKESK